MLGAGGGGALAILPLARAAAIAGCSSQHSSAPKAADDPDTADCTSGAQVIGGLQSTFGQLSDQLNGIGPASERGDLADLRNRVGTGANLAARIKSSLDSATASMSSPAPKRAYSGVADAGDRLHAALAHLDQAVQGAAPADGAVDDVQRSLNDLNTAVTTMRLSCSTVYAESTVAPEARRAAGR
ncbi:hypothetical protein NDR87_26600 [Nocardia sp. CDC159]|uniref:hypothetical protein n=1 Tax=Nocardia sp. CDC159 TaxID=2951409 RepID=UPI00207322B4|nr:hypothetical protein [Nocardia sp. CDC159]MCM6789948.1 hypothetical protein [Nocardia sp. CDC159]